METKNTRNMKTIENIFEGSLEVKLPTIWTDESRGGKSQREEKSRREKSRREKESEERICRYVKR